MTARGAAATARARPTEEADGGADGGAAPPACADNDAGLKTASGGKAAHCTSARVLCRDPQFGPRMRRECPKACGACGSAAATGVVIRVGAEVPGSSGSPPLAFRIRLRLDLGSPTSAAFWVHAATHECAASLYRNEDFLLQGKIGCDGRAPGLKKGACPAGGEPDAGRECPAHDRRHIRLKVKTFFTDESSSPSMMMMMISKPARTSKTKTLRYYFK